jgi:hypothetical protein
VRVAAVVSDLMLFSRIDAAAASAGASLIRVDEPAALPPPDSVDVVLVDWSARRPEWASSLAAWLEARDAPRVIVFGQHTDLVAHADARSAGLGPMWARSRLLAELPALLDVPASAEVGDSPDRRGRA